MKCLSALLLASLLLAVVPGLHAGSGDPLLVQIQGTITFQKGTTVEDASIGVQRLNNERLFDEFGLSQRDYALIIDSSSFNVLFRQKNSSAGLPDVVVLDLQTDGVAINLRKGIGHIAGPTTSPATGNFFEGLAGTVAGKLGIDGPMTSPSVGKYSLKFLGTCRHPDPTVMSTAVLRFSLKSTGEF